MGGAEGDEFEGMSVKFLGLAESHDIRQSGSKYLAYSDEETHLGPESRSQKLFLERRVLLVNAKVDGSDGLEWVIRCWWELIRFGLSCNDPEVEFKVPGASIEAKDSQAIARFDSPRGGTFAAIGLDFPSSSTILTRLSLSRLSTKF